MLEDIKRAEGQLANPDSGWVTRRDAAVQLSRAAVAAVEALKAHEDELDVDVRRVIEQGLGEASAALAGVQPLPAVKEYSLEELARSCAKPGQRVVAPHGNGFVVQVETKGGRRQAVYLMRTERKDGQSLVRIFTECGRATQESLHWALRANMNLSHGALALSTESGEERLVVINCYLADYCTPNEVRASVKELAFYGDWIEKKLTGLDDF